MSGVVYLWTSGSWPLAVIVFIASIAVPMLKILALIFLVVSAQMRSTGQSATASADLSGGGARRALVDARYLRHHHSGRAGAVQGARDHPGRTGRDCFRLGRRSDDVRRDVVRSAPDLGRMARRKHDKVEQIMASPRSTRFTPSHSRGGRLAALALAHATGLARAARRGADWRLAGGQGGAGQGPDHHHQLRHRRRSRGRQDQDQVQERRYRRGQECDACRATTAT